MTDVIVVGAGSAGAAVAGRLTEDPDISVLLLEAGPSDRVKEVAIPAAFSKLFRTERDWAYETEPQAELDGRRLFWPRGKMLGGSSSMNAMMWVRGVPEDYDAWAAAGAAGWAYEDVLPFFRRIENAQRTDGRHVGEGGPLPIEDQRDPNPTTSAFVEACVRAGFRRNPNANAGDNEGVDFAQVTQRRGRRASAAWAYLRPAMRRPNLEVVTDALVTRVVIESGRAVGVRYRRNDTEHHAQAREVVLSGGTVNSPQLLALSGIGPRGDLEALGIEVVTDLPGVGRNLSDHLVAGFVVGTDRTDTLVSAESLGNLVRYLLARRGPLTSNVGEAHAFFRSDPSLDAPDLELLFAPVPFLDHGATDPPGHGFTLGTILLQPRSRGTIRLRAADPSVPPAIDPAYLSDPEDLRILVSGLRRAQEVLGTEPLAAMVAGPMRPEALPRTDADREAVVRRHAETLYHPVGTCAMGTGADAVVDPELRVHGIEGLRVADASVMPTLNRGHTNAPAIMIGERAADFVGSALR